MAGRSTWAGRAGHRSPCHRRRKRRSVLRRRDAGSTVPRPPGELGSVNRGPPPGAALWPPARGAGQVRRGVRPGEGDSRAPRGSREGRRSPVLLAGPRRRAGPATTGRPTGRQRAGRSAQPRGGHQPSPVSTRTSSAPRRGPAGRDRRVVAATARRASRPPPRQSPPAFGRTRGCRATPAPPRSQEQQSDQDDVPETAPPRLLGHLDQLALGPIRQGQQHPLAASENSRRRAEASSPAAAAVPGESARERQNGTGVGSRRRPPRRRWCHRHGSCRGWAVVGHSTPSRRRTHAEYMNRRT